MEEPQTRAAPSVDPEAGVPGGPTTTAPTVAAGSKPPLAVREAALQPATIQRTIQARRLRGAPVDWSFLRGGVAAGSNATYPNLSSRVQNISARCSHEYISSRAQSILALVAFAVMASFDQSHQTSQGGPRFSHYPAFNFLGRPLAGAGKGRGPGGWGGSLILTIECIYLF